MLESEAILRESAAEMLSDTVTDGALAAADALPLRTLSMTLSYHGAPFCGFARQPGQCTVQGELEHALSVMLHRPVETVCAGRTDAGVHARGQVVSFSLQADEFAERFSLTAEDGSGASALDEGQARRFLRSVNALSHDAISARELQLRAPGFSARFDAVEREYRYFIYTGAPPPVFLRDFCWHLPQALDVEAMRQAAAFLVGEHDFKSFCLAVSAKDKPTCRCVTEVSFAPYEAFGEQALAITVRGNAFLHSMVRTMVGTLVLVGRGLRPPEWVRDVLEAQNRAAAGENAPAAGLVFWTVRY